MAEGGSKSWEALAPVINTLYAIKMSRLSALIGLFENTPIFTPLQDLETQQVIGYKQKIAKVLRPYLDERRKDETWKGFSSAGLGRLDDFLTALERAQSLEDIKAAFSIAKTGKRSWDLLAPIFEDLVRLSKSPKTYR